MSQYGIAVVPLLTEDGQSAIFVCKQSDQSREGMSCGLDIEPEVASHEMVEIRKNMKKLQIAIFTISLSAAMSASAQIYTGTDLNSLAYQDNGVSGDAQYVPANPISGAPALAQLYSPDLSVAGDNDGYSPAVFVEGPFVETLSSLVASYDLYSSTMPTGQNPYWILWMTDDTGYTLPIVSTGGGPLNSSSLVHVGDLTHGSITLSALCADNDPNSGLPYGPETVAWVGLEIGDGGNGAGGVEFDSITISSVPEPTTMTILIAGGLLLPFTLRMLRKTRVA